MDAFCGAGRARAAWSTLALAMLAVGALGAPGRAQVIPLAPPGRLDGFRKQVEIAVLDVHRNGTVQIDLCLSLRDEVREPREIALLLPLQTRPDGVEISRMAVAQFQRQTLAESDRSYALAAIDEARRERALRSTLGLASVAAGPVAVALAPPVSFRHRRYRVESESLMATPPPLDSAVRVAEAQVEVHDALAPDEVPQLAGLPELDRDTTAALAEYAGRPFALLKLKTVPFRPPPHRQEFPPERSPGLHLRFEQRMVEQEGTLQYAYPLLAEGGWKALAPVTQVYVLAPGSADLTVDLPRRPLTSNLRGYMSTMAYLDEGAGWSAGGLQVYQARYDGGSEGESVRLRLGTGTESRFAAARREAERRLSKLKAVLLLLGALLWTLSFSVLVRTDAHARALGFFRALAKSWLCTSALLLGPVVLFHWARWATYRRALLELLASMEVTEAHIVAGVVLAAALLLVGAGLAVARRAGRGGYRGFLVRGLAAALVSGAAYVPLGRLLIGWLSG